MIGELVGLVAVSGGLAIPFFAIWIAHRQKMMEMQLRLKQTNDSNAQATIEALREEVRSLRDTTMQYDISFDTALQRMEQRMAGMERRVQEIENAAPAEMRVGR